MRIGLEKTKLNTSHQCWWQQKKNKDDKANSFPQIRDFMKKKCKPSKKEFATWTAENVVEKRNNFHS